MLRKEELVQWFHDNGIEVGISFPTVLIERLIKKAHSRDPMLFKFLETAFRVENSQCLFLKYADWDECYKRFSTFSLHHLQ